MSSQFQQLSTLPGPGAHLDAVSLLLDSGMSCLWLVPDALVSSGIADTLLNELAERPDSVRLPPPKSPPANGWPTRPQLTTTEAIAENPQERPAWARDVFNVLVSDSWPSTASAQTEMFPEPNDVSLTERLAEALHEELAPHDDQLTALATSPRLMGRAVVVCGWDELNPTAVGGLLTRLPAVAKEHGIPLAERPRLLVAARPEDLPEGVFDRIDPVTTRVVWWWGAIGRLDTAVVIASTRSRQAGSGQVGHPHPALEWVIREVIAEIAGPDLSLARQLATHWTGRMDTLADELAAVLPVAEQTTSLPLSGSGNTASPPVRLRSAWTQGLVDQWDGQVRANSLAITAQRREADLRTQIWRGQNRALGPLIDEQRIRLEKIVRSRASRTSIAEIFEDVRIDRRPAGRRSIPPDRTVLELGPMAWAIGNGRIRIPDVDRNLLFCLRDARNALAHLTPLTDTDLEALMESLPPNQ